MSTQKTIARLLDALEEMTPGLPPADAMCHKGIVPQERCAHCGRIKRALEAIEEGKKAARAGAREWLNVLNILESIDEVPGLTRYEQTVFQRDPGTFLRKADDRGQSLVWAEVERRLAGGA